MRSLTASLLMAQRNASAHPYVKVELLDRRPDVARPIMTRLYVGQEPDAHHAAVVAGDGSLVRARVDSLGRLWVQRTASPGPGSDFSAWTQLDNAHPGASIVLTALGPQVLLLFVDTNRYTIRSRQSSNYGASWGGSTVVLNPPEMTLYLAAAYRPSGVPALFYVSSDQLLWATKRTGGVWSPPLAWPHTEVAQFKGIACIYGTDWDLAVCGTHAAGEEMVWTAIYGDGGEQAADTWSALREHNRASQGSGVEFRHPFLAKPDVFRLSYVESYAGSTPYSRPVLSHTPPGAGFVDNRWRDGVPFDLECDHGLALAYGGGYLWLSTPDGVWRGALDPQAVSFADNVLSLHLREGTDGGGGLVVLRPEALPSLRRGSQVRVSLGYITSAGAETSTGLCLWVERWEQCVSAGRSVLHLHLGDGWSLLGGWRARRQFAWASGEATVREILTDILSRSGMALEVVSASDAFHVYMPDFTVHPGEDGAKAVRRLMALVPDVLFFRGGQACVRYLQPSDEADYAYGTGHAILEGRCGTALGSYNRVQAFGDGVTGEAFAWDEVEEAHDRLLQLHDLNLDTAEKAQDRADALLHMLGLAATAEVVVPVNCGQELYDVVEVTGPGLGLDAARYRVLGLELRYDRERTPRYTHTLRLGGE